MSLNNITDANILPSDFTTDNPFQSAVQTHGTDQHRNVVTYIKNLLREYIKVRNEGVTSDTYRVNKELLKKFKSDFKDLLLEISKNPDNFLNLENIINDVYKETQVSNKIVTEINSVILEIIKKAIKEKITGKIKDKLSVVDLTKLKTSIELSPLTDVETERIVNSIIVDTNPVIQNLQNELGVSNQTYRDTLFDMFKTQLQDDADRRKFLEEDERRKPFNQLMQNFSLFGKIDRSVMKRIDSICNRIFILINKSITEKAFLMMSKFVKFIAFIPLKILGAVGKFVKYIGKKFLSIIGWTVKALGTFIKNIIKITTKIVIGLVSNLILKPIFFISEVIWKSLKTSFKIIGNLTQGIFKTVKFIFEKTKVHFLLLTPPGLYALGFLIGFVWEKLKQVISGTTFPLDGVVKFYHSLTQDVSDLIKGIIDFASELYSKTINFIKETYDTVDQWMWEYLPNTRRTLSELADSTKEFAKNWKENGFISTFKKTKIWEWIKNIINSPVISFTKTIFNTIKGLYKWIGDHPSISAFIFGSSAILQNIDVLSTIKNCISFRGNILSGLIAGLTAYATMAATDSVINIFDGTADMKEATWKLSDDQNLLRKYIAQSSDNEDVFNKNNVTIYNKHQVASKYILENYKRITKLNQELAILQDFITYYKGFSSEIGGDLQNVVNNVVTAILKGGATEEQKQRLFNARKSGMITEQITILRTILSDQSQYITSLQQSLNSATTETVEDVLNSIVDDNMQIKDTRDSDFISILQKIKNTRPLNELSKMMKGKKFSKSQLDQIHKALLDNYKVRGIDPYADKLMEYTTEHYESKELSRGAMSIGGINMPMQQFIRSQQHVYHAQLANKKDVLALQLSKRKDDISKLFYQNNTTSLQREKIIEKIIKHGSENDFMRINELLRKYDETQGMDSSIARDMEKLKNEVLERHRLKIEKQTEKAIYDFNDLTLRSINDCNDYKLSCDIQNKENHKLSIEKNVPYSIEYYQEKLDQIRIPQKPNIITK